MADKEEKYNNNSPCCARCIFFSEPRVEESPWCMFYKTRKIPDRQRCSSAHSKHSEWPHHRVCESFASASASAVSFVVFS